MSPAQEASAADPARDDGAPRRLRHLPDPPGPVGAPLFGSLGPLRRNPMDFFTRISQRWGGIVRYRYGRKDTYLVSTPELIHELLVTKRHLYLKNRRYKALRQLIGNGLLHSEGDVWKRQRSVTSKAFRKHTIESRIPRMAEVVDECLDRWDGFADGEEAVNVDPELSIISETLIGDWILGARHRRKVDRIIDVTRRLVASWPPPPRSLLGSFRPPPLRRLARVRRCIAELDECIFGAIALERQEPSDDHSALSILSRDDGGEPFSDDELRDQLITLYMAGFETSAAVNTWLFYRLSMQPQIRARVCEEVDEVLGGRRPCGEDIPRLDLTRRVIEETLRLYPPAYNFTRVALEDHAIGGFRVPAGAMVIVSPWATHRLAPHWENPEGFDPDRFLPQARQARPRYAYIPFGAGHRTCIGAGLAMVQATLVVAAIAQRYLLDLEPAHRVEHVAGTVMRPRYGMRMLVRTRGRNESGA